MRAIGQLFTTKSRIDEPLEKQLVTNLQDSSVFLWYPSLSIYLSPPPLVIRAICDFGVGSSFLSR